MRLILIQPIPTLREWGFAVLVLLLMAAAWVKSVHNRRLS